MKIRYYANIDGWRWIGFVLAMIGTFILSGNNSSVLWLGWVISCFSCMIWIYMGYKDKDTPRALMEVFYFLLAIRGVYNWL